MSKHLKSASQLSVLLMLCAPALLAQRGEAIATRVVEAEVRTSAVAFGSILGVKALSGGRVLVNDGTRRRLVVLDSTLTLERVLLDTLSEGQTYYGPVPSALISFGRNTALFVDVVAGSLLSIGGDGVIRQTIASPRAGDLRILATSSSGADDQGNLLYRVPGSNRATAASRASAGERVMLGQLPDSGAIVRASFDTRSVDTIGYIRQPNPLRTTFSVDASGRRTLSARITPLETVDDWTVLADGSVALVRGQDYHIDWIRPDGSRESTPRMPLEWRPISLAEKHRYIDSVRASIEAIQRQATERGGTAAALEAMRSALLSLTPKQMGDEFRQGFLSRSSARPQQSGSAMITVEYAAPAELPDFYPPLRPGAVRADEDGRLWILPSTSHAEAGELRYDVVSNTGVLVERVRLPRGRSIAGFGQGGVLYLMTRTKDGAWALERARLMAEPPRAAPARSNGADVRP